MGRILETQTRRSPLGALLVSVAVAGLAGCTTSNAVEDGVETGACIEGSCFDDLECLSDLCVAPDGGTSDDASAGSQSTSTSGPVSTSGTATNPSGPGTSTDPTVDPTVDPTDDPTVDPSTGSSSSGESGETEPESGCPRVDYLIVIDNSASTETFQSQLVESLPHLVAGINEVGGDFHIGVVTTDVYFSNTTECAVLGGLVVETGGSSSSATACGPYAAGENYMTSEDALGQSLACAVRVGTSGSGDERAMEAMLTATSDTLPCNAGFLRDDSLLVVIIVTDEYDGPLDPNSAGSPGSANSWYADLLAQRGGPETNTVVGVLTNYEDGPCPPSELAFDGVELVAFANMFTHGVVGGICEDFAPFVFDLNDAVNLACEGFGR